MRKRISADRGSAITLTAILTKFKNNTTHTQASLRTLLRENGYMPGIAKPIMECLKDMGCISNHGKYGNKCHFNANFRTSHLMVELSKRGVIS